MAQVHTSYTNGRTGVISTLVRIKIDVGFIVNWICSYIWNPSAHCDRLCAAIVQFGFWPVLHRIVNLLKYKSVSAIGCSTASLASSIHIVSCYSDNCWIIYRASLTVIRNPSLGIWWWLLSRGSVLWRPVGAFRLKCKWYPKKRAI